MEASQTPPTAPPEQQAPDQQAAAPPDPNDTNAMLSQLIRSQSEQRAEIAALREELARSKAAPPAPPSQVQSAEDLLAARMQEVDAHDYYCPACGLLYDYPRECTGPFTGYGHAPVEVVSTDELKSGDSAKHTPAPGQAA